MNTKKLLLTLFGLLATGMAIAAVSTGSYSAGDKTTTLPRQYMVTSWLTAVSAGGPATQDAATITNPTTQIVNSTTVELTREGHIGRYGAFRLAYSGVPSANPTVTIWGQTDSDAWQKLRNLNGDLTMTFACNTALDETDGTLYYTGVDPILHVVDFMGCNKIRVGIQTAFNGTVTNTSLIQAKVIE